MRTSIPSSTAARALFESDRTCCVCRVKGKPVQIHHIDENNANHELQNLAVLCLDCHNDTQIQGGFHRKLDSDQVILYRNDWIRVVSQNRAKALAEFAPVSEKTDIAAITSIAEKLREKRQFDLLAIQYSIWGNTELRDKYIELAIAKTPDLDASEEIFLRSLQDRTELVGEERISQAIMLKRKHEDWSQLGRLYAQIKKYPDAVECYCKTVINSLKENRYFSAAYYLKEACEDRLYEPLFELALQQSAAAGELWWQVRALQELEWRSELKQLLVENKEKIEAEGDPSLLLELYRALGEEEKASELHKQLSIGIERAKIREDGTIEVLPYANEESPDKLD